MYNQDVAPLMAIPLGLSVRMPRLFAASPTPVLWAFIGLMIVTTIATELVFAHRMVVAYTHYMQFDRPSATILASQIITALVCLNLVMAPLLFQ
jgi:hypothetical protein